MFVIRILITMLSFGFLAYEFYKLIVDIKSRKNKPPNIEKKDDING